MGSHPITHEPDWTITHTIVMYTVSGGNLATQPVIANTKCIFSS